MSVGKSVRLFLADGTPGGLLTAEIMNWTGHIIAAPRSDLANLLKRPETSRTGIYLLLGDDPDSPGNTFAYIGEGDEVGKRLAQHAKPEEQNGKDFWNRAIVITSKDANLTKAHARYLESRFISLAVRAQRARLINSTVPPPIQLPEADVSDMEYFISEAQIILPILNVNIFRAIRIPTKDADQTPVDQSDATPSSPLFEMYVRSDGIHATAQEVDGEFTVLEGSLARARWSGGQSGYQQLREKLKRDGTLIPIETHARLYQFTRNAVFASPSAAAAVVAGRRASGRVEWRIQSTNKSLGQWQDESLQTSTPEETL